MLIDSNVIIYASQMSNVALLNYLKKEEQNLAVSSLSKVEVLGYHQLKKVEKTFLENFFNAINLMPISEAIVEKAIEIKQKGAIEVRDAIVAATAILHDLPLCTENKKNFAKIEGLKLLSIEELI